MNQQGPISATGLEARLANPKVEGQRLATELRCRLAGRPPWPATPRPFGPCRRRPAAVPLLLLPRRPQPPPLRGGGAGDARPRPARPRPLRPPRPGNNIFPWLTGLRATRSTASWPASGTAVSLETCGPRWTRNCSRCIARLDSEPFADERAASARRLASWSTPPCRSCRRTTARRWRRSTSAARASATWRAWAHHREGRRVAADPRPQGVPRHLPGPVPQPRARSVAESEPLPRMANRGMNCHAYDSAAVGDQNVERLLGPGLPAGAPDAAFVRGARSRLLSAPGDAAPSPVSRRDFAPACASVLVAPRLAWAHRRAAAVVSGVAAGAASRAVAAALAASKTASCRRPPTARSVPPRPARRQHPDWLAGLTAAAPAPRRRGRRRGGRRRRRRPDRARQRRRVPLPDGSVLYLNQNTTVHARRPSGG